jgi:hypothetical protein
MTDFKIGDQLKLVKEFDRYYHDGHGRSMKLGSEAVVTGFTKNSDMINVRWEERNILPDGQYLRERFELYERVADPIEKLVTAQITLKPIANGTHTPGSLSTKGFSHLFGCTCNKCDVMRTVGDKWDVWTGEMEAEVKALQDKIADLEKRRANGPPSPITRALKRALSAPMDGRPVIRKEFK